jgi:hypothetical protein
MTPKKGEKVIVIRWTVLAFAILWVVFVGLVIRLALH